MLTNKQIHISLKNNRGSLDKFASYLSITRQALEFRLRTEALKNNLDGMFKEFLANEFCKITMV